MNNSFRNRIKKQIQKEVDAVFGITYKVWVINTSFDAQLYLWDHWKNIYPKVDSILNVAQTDAYIRTFQSYEFESKWLGFGRMKWNEANNKKWTTRYRIDESENKKLQFFNTEIWAPDWNKCMNDDAYPEVFVNLYQHFNHDSIKEGIVIAIKNKILNKYDEILAFKIQEITTLVPGSTVASISRYWTPGKGFKNRIEDMNPQELEMIINGKK